MYGSAACGWPTYARVLFSLIRVAPKPSVYTSTSSGRIAGAVPAREPTPQLASGASPCHKPHPPGCPHPQAKAPGRCPTREEGARCPRRCCPRGTCAAWPQATPRQWLPRRQSLPPRQRLQPDRNATDVRRARDCQRPARQWLAPVAAARTTRPLIRKRAADHDPKESCGCGSFYVFPQEGVGSNMPFVKPPIEMFVELEVPKPDTTLNANPCSPVQGIMWFGVPRHGAGSLPEP